MNFADRPYQKSRYRYHNLSGRVPPSKEKSSFNKVYFKEILQCSCDGCTVSHLPRSQCIFPWLLLFYVIVLCPSDCGGAKARKITNQKVVEIFAESLAFRSNHETEIIPKMEGQIETNFDLLRAWDFTSLYEKSYFILVHFALLLLGIYSIRSRMSDWKARARPSQSNQPSSWDQVNGKPSRGQEARCMSGRDVIWANEAALWLLRNSCGNDALNTWISKMNARLLQNMSKGKVQIDQLDKDDIVFAVDKIRSYKPEIKDQMNIVVHLHIERVKLRITHTTEDSRDIPSNLVLQSISPMLHIQLINFNGKIRTCLKLSCMNVDDFEIHLDNKDINVELIRDSFRRSLQDTITLEPTRGILKKEIKTETKVKEISPQVYENHFEEDSKRHILVTDLDSAIAEKSSNSLQETEDSMAKDGKKTSLKLSITSPLMRTALLPEITVLPATPLAADLDESRMFSVKSLLSDGEDRPNDYDEQNEARASEDGDRHDESTSESKVNAEWCDELLDVKEDFRARDELSVELEANEESKEATGECLSEGRDHRAGAEDVLVESKEANAEEEHEEKPSEDSLNEIFDTSSESSKESWSLKKEQKKARPKSMSEMAIDNDDVAGSNCDSAMHMFMNTGSKQNIDRVNTFHLGSKSMVSIATTPKRSESVPLRATTSQLSLVSPVGYSPNKPSALIIEADDQGKKRHYHVPPAIARKGTYEQHGVKLHVYNGHIFIAQHFSKPLPLCAVCNLPLGRRIGKQGYQCRDCKAITHKRCHNLIGACEESSLPALLIEYPWSTDV